MTVLAGVLTAVLAATPGEVDRVGVAAVLALVVGALYLLARLLRLGVLATFLSRPILTGFFAGVSLSILIGQIGRMTGVKIEAEGLVAPLVELAHKAGSIHLPTLLLAAAMFVLLQVVRMTRFPVPGPVVVVVVSVLLSALFDFEGHGIAVVGDIPAGLPALTLPRLAGLPIDTILLGAAAIFLVSFGAGIVLDASAIVQVDSTGAAMLEEVAADFAGRGISLGIAELHTEPKALLERAGFVERDRPRDDLRGHRGCVARLPRLRRRRAL